MNRRRRNDVNLTILAIGFDAVLTFLGFYFIDMLCEQRVSIPMIGPSESCFPRWSYAAVSVFWSFSFFIGSAYDPKRIYKFVDEFQTIFLSIAFGFLLFSGFLFITGQQVPRGWFFLFFFLDMIVLFGWRLILRIYFRTLEKKENTKSILIVGATEPGRLIVKAIHQTVNNHLNIVGYLDDCRQETNNGLPILGETAEIREIVKKYTVDEIIFALPLGQYEQVLQLVMKVDDIPVRVRVIPDYFNFSYHRTRIENFQGIPLIGLRDPSLNEVQLLFKRIFDMILASIGLLLLWPLFLLIGLAIKLDSPGPIIFEHFRVGENGRKFRMYKFRSMIHNHSTHLEAEEMMDEPAMAGKKTPNDPRITRVGRFLRRSSLDELPQFVNILRGDMSFVGPRPEVPWRVASYEPWKRVRFSVPQGLTGWWQVNGRANRPMHLHTQDDLYYIDNYSIWLDLQILLKTPLVVIRGKGAF